MYLNALADLSNLLFIAAYWAKDILWLRFLAMLGSLVIIPYYLLQAEPLWTVVRRIRQYSRDARLGHYEGASAHRVQWRRTASIQKDVQRAVTPPIQTSFGYWGVAGPEPRVRAAFHWRSIGFT